MDLFVYGLLQYPQILKPLIGYLPHGIPAQLQDYHKCVLDWPDHSPTAVAMPCAGKSIVGVVWRGITPEAMAFLDEFEMVPEGIYQRQTVTALNPQTQDALLCETYVLGDAVVAERLGGEWEDTLQNDASLEAFIRDILPDYARFSMD